MSDQRWSLESLAPDVEGDDSLLTSPSWASSLRSKSFSLTPYRRSGLEFQWSDSVRQLNVSPFDDSGVEYPDEPTDQSFLPFSSTPIQRASQRPDLSGSSLGEFSGGNVSSNIPEQLDEGWETFKFKTDGQYETHIFKRQDSEYLSDITEDLPILENIGYFIDYPNGVLGTGQFGVVYRGYIGTNVEDFKNVEPFRRFAVKVMDFNEEMSDSHKQDFETEKYIITKVKHRNIVSIIDIVHIGEHHFLPFEDYPEAIYMTPDRAYLFMEYADVGTIGLWISRNFHNWDPSTRVRFIKGLFSGMRYMHRNNIFHGDVHVGNVLLFTEAQLLVAKWADFGISKIADLTQYRRRISQITVEIIQQSCRSDVIRMFNIFQRILFMRKTELETPQQRYQISEFEKMIKIKNAESIDQIYYQFIRVLQ